MLSPYRNVFSERIQAANNSHMNVAPHSPVSSISRERSPFRRGSPYAAPIDSIGPSPAHLSSAAQVRERQKAEEDAMALQQHQYRTEEEMRTPKTISPKDAVLEFHESEEDSKMPLFPSEESMDRAFEGLPSFRRQSSNFNFTPASIPAQVQVPQQYPFISQQRRQNSSFRSRAEGTPEFPAHLTSMESSASESNAESVVTEVPKPAQTSADSGTYTCTYHGCTLRFESPAKLQKHKREGHRQSTPSQASYGASGLSPAALRNSQAGPHRCDRINPQTGKPCSTIFSRPYDLTRHEDTIHNARKRKVRCQYCVEDKTFSRNDALTRHMRVVHPEIEFSGKSKKHDD
jgi:26S proteasome regulatory subunit N4